MERWVFRTDHWKPETDNEGTVTNFTVKIQWNTKGMRNGPTSSVPAVEQLHFFHYFHFKLCVLCVWKWRAHVEGEIILE